MSQYLTSDRWTGVLPDPFAFPVLFDGILWRRPLAYLIDAAIIGALFGAWLWLVLISFGLLWILTSIAFLLIPILYHACLVGGRRSATLGMRVCGLEVRSWDGERPDFWQALLMAALFYVTVVGTSLLILLVVLINDRRRTVHDYLSGVVVIRRDSTPAGFGVTVQSRSRPLIFLLTREASCPYLPGRRERKLVTELSGPDAAESYDLLSRAGFRRSHAVAYRPACHGCQECVPVRVVVDQFQPGRSLRRVMRRNAGLNNAIRPAQATSEQYALFNRYLSWRHGEGEMAGMGFADYRSMVDDTPIDSGLLELRDEEGALIACCLVDRSSDGLSAVYSFFDPDRSADSLGSFIVLRLIEEARRRGLPYVYLGYWIAASRKMAYKVRFQPLEAFGAEGWALMDRPAEAE